MPITLPRLVVANIVSLHFRILNDFRILGAIFLLVTQSLSAADRDGTSKPIQPWETGVLLLPALDATADAANMQTPRQLVIRHRQQVELLTRRFKVMGDAMALRAIKISPAINVAQLSRNSMVGTTARLDRLNYGASHYQ